MAKGASDRQAALRLFARGVETLRETGALGPEDVRDLLPAWRALAPRSHPLAGADVLDCRTLARLQAWSTALLDAQSIAARPGNFREPASARPLAGEARVALDGVSAADALAVTLTVSLEAAKRAHGLGAPVDDLKAAFSSPQHARDALDALVRAGDARTLSFDASDDTTSGAIVAAVGDRPCIVACGAAARAMHDLWSPYARRLGARLALAGRRAAPSDDDVYRGIARIEDAARASIAERLAQEASDGLIPCGRALVVQADRVREASCDRRIREAVATLKKARVALVCAFDDDALDAALRALDGCVRALWIVTEGTAPCAPDALSDVHGTLVAITPRAFELGRGAAVLTSLATPLVFGADDAIGCVDASAFGLAQVALRARTAARSPFAADAAWVVRCVEGDDVDALYSTVTEALMRAGAPAPRARGKR